MTEAGLVKINLAQKDVSWYALDNIEALIVPDDLRQALDLNADAEHNFKTFSNSLKKNILFWLDSTKRVETKLSRINKIVAAVSQNKSPL